MLQNCTIDSKLKQQYFNHFYIDIKSAFIINSILAYSHALHKTLVIITLTVHINPLIILMETISILFEVR